MDHSLMTAQLTATQLAERAFGKRPNQARSPAKFNQWRRARQRLGLDVRLIRPKLSEEQRRLKRRIYERDYQRERRARLARTA